MAFPSVDQLTIELSAGQGVAIIVEGDSYEDDPFFYRRWFDDRASEVSFFPQNGWTQVIAAVKELRQRLTDVPVYGIIDRDFCDDHELDRDFEALGVLRTPRYTLENYLLDPQCWAATFKLIFSRNRSLAQGWDDEAQVAAMLTQAHQACCGLAAHNWVVKTINERYEAQPTFSARTYLNYKNAATVATALESWGHQQGLNEDLKEMFESHWQDLQTQTSDVHHRHVSGKYVLQHLHQQSPYPPTKKRHPLDHLLDLYLDRCSTPPTDLIELIDRIINHARK